LPFLLAGVVLFIAMVGSIILTTRLLVFSEKRLTKPSEMTSPNLSAEERKRILSEPSPMLAKTVEKQKLEYHMPIS